MYKPRSFQTIKGIASLETWELGSAWKDIRTGTYSPILLHVPRAIRARDISDRVTNRKKDSGEHVISEI